MLTITGIALAVDGGRTQHRPVSFGGEGQHQTTVPACEQAEIDDRYRRNHAIPKGRNEGLLSTQPGRPPASYGTAKFDPTRPP